MADYTATAICEGDHWVIDVPGVGTTQADSVDDLEEMALDLVIAKTHNAPEEVHIRVTVVCPGHRQVRRCGAGNGRPRCRRSSRSAVAPTEATEATDRSSGTTWTRGVEASIRVLTGVDLVEGRPTTDTSLVQGSGGRGRSPPPARRRVPAQAGPCPPRRAVTSGDGPVCRWTARRPRWRSGACGGPGPRAPGRRRSRRRSRGRHGRRGRAGPGPRRSAGPCPG